MVASQKRRSDYTFEKKTYDPLQRIHKTKAPDRKKKQKYQDQPAISLQKNFEIILR